MAKFFWPARMLSSVAGSGLRAALPPTVIECFTRVASELSKLPGLLTWQPLKSSTRLAPAIAQPAELGLDLPRRAQLRRAPGTPEGLGLFVWSISFHDDGHLHVGVSLSAEVIADQRERAGGLRGEFYIHGFARFNQLVNLELPREESVDNIGAFHPQDDRLAALEGDHVRSEFEALGGDFYDTRRALRLRAERRAQHDHASQHERKHKTSSVLHQTLPRCSDYLSPPSSTLYFSSSSERDRLQNLLNSVD